MEDSKSKTFEVGKFYRICSIPVYGGGSRIEVPHLVVKKTKRQIVFECMYRTFDGHRKKVPIKFRLDRYSDGSESARSSTRWSMIPTMFPDKPCEKPQKWDSVQ